MAQSLPSSGSSGHDGDSNSVVRRGKYGNVHFRVVLVMLSIFPTIVWAILAKLLFGGLNRKWRLLDEIVVRLFRFPRGPNVDKWPTCLSHRYTIGCLTWLLRNVFRKYVTAVKIPSQMNPAKKHDAYWIHNGDIKEDATAILLYIHGGGFVFGSPLQYLPAHRAMVDECKAKGLTLKVLAIKYPLAPEVVYPSQLDVVMEVYQWLRNHYSSAKIFIGGDSAGGNCTIGTAVRLKATKLPMPTGLVTISPWVVSRTTSPSIDSNAPFDLLCREDMEAFGEFYRGNTSLSDPGISPLFANLSGLPPTLVSYGGREVMRDDILEFIEKLRKSGVAVTSVGDDEMYHIYPLPMPFFRSREANEALAEVSKFIIKESLSKAN